MGSGMTSAKNAAQSTPPNVFALAADIILSKLAKPDSLVAEYRAILEADARISATCFAAEEATNRPRNRYVNVLPYDSNRVKLNAEPNYINASQIRLQDPLGFEVAYIASQGPLPSTSDDFWRMVHENRCPAIIMLTNTIERNVSKCHAYFPSNVGDTLVWPASGLEVACSRVSSPGQHGVVVRNLRLRPTKGNGEAHEITHYHYTSWPDHGTPRGAGAVCLISDQIAKMRSLNSRASRAVNPVVVHCSAGIGRTGTFCAIDVLRMRAAAVANIQPPVDAAAACTAAALTDVPGIVRELRQQRMGMVQTLDQYVFCYEAMAEELKNLADQSRH